MQDHPPIMQPVAGLGGTASAHETDRDFEAFELYCRKKVFTDFHNTILYHENINKFVKLKNMRERSSCCLA
jgi:hypothetical protein